MNKFVIFFTGAYESNTFTGSVTTIPSSSVSQIMRGNVNVMSTNNAASTTVPIAKVVPQQQPPSNDGHHPTAVSVNSGQTQNVFIHARSTNPVVSNASTGNTLPANASFLQAGGTFYYEPSSTGSGISNVLTLATTTVTSNLTPAQSQGTSIGE